MKRVLTKKVARSVRKKSKSQAMSAAIPSAALTTLSHRLPMLWSHAFIPQPANQSEITRMVTEKVEAGAEAARGAQRGAGAALKATLTYADRQGQAQARLISALFSGDAANLVPLWSQMCQAAASDATALAAELLAAGTDAELAMVAPVHRRVTANARRLSRHKA